MVDAGKVRYRLGSFAGILPVSILGIVTKAGDRPGRAYSHFATFGKECDVVYQLPDITAGLVYGGWASVNRASP